MKEIHLNQNISWTKIYMALKEIYGEEAILGAFTNNKLAKAFQKVHGEKKL